MKSSGLSTEPWWTPAFTSNCTHYQHGHGSAHWHTSPAPVAQFTPTHQVFSAPTRWPSEALNQRPSPCLWKPCRVSCWQLDASLAAAWQQRFRLLCLCLGIVSWHHSPLQDFHDLLCQLETMVVAPFQCIPPYPQWNSTPSWRVPCHHKWLQLWGWGARVTSCLYHLHHYAW